MKETVEEIRARLLGDERVLQAIQQRAYEIWILRGRQHGRAEEDWRLAENEVIGFLIEQELRKPAEVASVEVAAIVDPIMDANLSEAGGEVVAVVVEEVVEEVVVSTPLDITPTPIPEADVVIPAEATAVEKKPRKRAATTAKAATAKRATSRAAKPAVKKTSAARKPATTKRASAKKSPKNDQPPAK